MEQWEVRVGAGERRRTCRHSCSTCRDDPRFHRALSNSSRNARGTTRVTHRDALGRFHASRRRPMAARQYSRGLRGCRTKTGPLAGQTYRRLLRAVESPDLHSDQPAAHQASDHSKHGQYSHARRRHCFCRILRLRRLLEHIARSVFMPLRQYYGRVRWRGRSFETTGVRLRLLAGDNLRLRVLSVSSCRHDHRTVAKLGNKNVPGIWWPAPFWSLSKLRRHRMGAAPPCRWTSRAATENLAEPRGEPAVESFLVFRPTYGVHRPALFFPLCPARLCAL